MRMKQSKCLSTTIALLTILVLQIRFVQLVNAQEGEVTLNPTDDTFTSSYMPDSNYGEYVSLEITRFEFTKTVFERLVWMKFSLSEVPDGAVVDVATLELYCQKTSETYDVYAHSCSDNSWTQLSLTYTNSPRFNATPMDSTTISADYQWYSWNVVDGVRKGLNGIHGGSDLVTLVLQETTNRGIWSEVEFYSNEQSTNQPKLTIHWTHIVPEFSFYLVLPLFLIATLLIVIIYRRAG